MYNPDVLMFPSRVSAQAGCLSASDVFKVAAGLALSFGWLEGLETVALLWAPKIRPEGKVPIDVLWVAPVTYVMCFMLLAIPLYVLARWQPRVTRALVSFPLMFLGFGALLKYPRLLAGYAWMFLAFALAVVSYRFLRAREQQLTRWYGRTAQALAACTLLFFAGLQIHYANTFAVSGEAGHLAKERPNVLLIVMDTVRPDRLSCYGSKTLTPALDRLAARGILFERAYSPAAWSLPAHASLLTGKPLSVHGADWEQPVVPAHHRQLQEVFAAHGYATGAFVANHVWFTPEHGFGRGFRTFDAYDIFTIISRMAWAKALEPVRARLGWEVRPYRSAQEISNRFLEWQQRNGQRPFFAVLNFMDAHEPYITPSDPDSTIAVWRKRTSGGWSDAEKKTLVEQYDRAVRYLDEQIGRLADELRKREVWKNTLVVVTSDHGESFRYFDHGRDLREETIHVPLILRLPASRVTAKRVQAPVSLNSIPRTVAALAGISDADSFEGTLLTDEASLQTPPALEEPVLSEFTSQDGTLEAEAFVNFYWHYISYPLQHKEELFAQPVIPDMPVDLASDERYQGVLREMRQRAAAAKAHFAAERHSRFR